MVQHNKEALSAHMILDISKLFQIHLNRRGEKVQLRCSMYKMTECNACWWCAIFNACTTIYMHFQYPNNPINYVYSKNPVDHVHRISLNQSSRLCACHNKRNHVITTTYLRKPQWASVFSRALLCCLVRLTLTVLVA